jgi:hypothetical protein
MKNPPTPHLSRDLRNFRTNRTIQIPFNIRKPEVIRIPLACTTSFVAPFNCEMQNHPKKKTKRIAVFHEITKLNPKLLSTQSSRVYLRI